MSHSAKINSEHFATPPMGTPDFAVPTAGAAAIVCSSRSTLMVAVRQPLPPDL